MTKEAKKRWRGHSRFQQELAEYVGYAVIATGPARVDAVADLVEFLLYEGVKHENKHCEAEEGSPVDKRREREGRVPDGRRRDHLEAVAAELNDKGKRFHAVGPWEDKKGQPVDERVKVVSAEAMAILGRVE